jgi:hypothetical protein
MSTFQPDAAHLDIDALTARFEQLFHRTPSARDLDRFRRADSRVRLRLPARTRRRLARVIATL